MLGRRFTALRGSAKAMAGGGFYLWDWKHGVLDSLCGILFLYMHALVDIVLDDTFIVCRSHMFQLITRATFNYWLWFPHVNPV